MKHLLVTVNICWAVHRTFVQENPHQESFSMNSLFYYVNLIVLVCLCIYKTPQHAKARGNCNFSHLDFLLGNDRGKTCVWKKYNLVHFDSQKLRRKISELLYCSFEPSSTVLQNLPYFTLLAWTLKGQCVGTSPTLL